MKEKLTIQISRSVHFRSETLQFPKRTEVSDSGFFPRKKFKSVFLLRAVFVLFDGSVKPDRIPAYSANQLDSALTRFI